MIRTSSRRSYTEVMVVAAGDAFAVTLDGRAALTPGGARLRLPTRVLAEAVVREWQTQGDVIRPDTMPLTRLANSVIDRVIPERDSVINQLLSYAGTDLLCYRAETPEALVERQHVTWQPLLDWLARTHAVRLEVTCGVVPVTQPPAALGALRSAVASLDPYSLAAAATATAAIGSVVVALALVEGHIDGESAFAISELDRAFQNERWGEDPLDGPRRQRLREDIVAAGRFAALSGAT